MRRVGRPALAGLLLALLAGGCAPASSPARTAVSSSARAALARTPIDRAALVARVRAEILHSWQGYVGDAWGHDEPRPLSHGVRDWYARPLLMTPVDALDTLMIAGLDDEANQARALIDERLDFDVDSPVKNFEVTIRLLGGLLAAYQMTGDVKLLHLAEDLGHRLLPAFDTPTGMPYMYVNLHTGKASGNKSNPAEIGTLVLEYGTLSKLSGDPIFFAKAKRALQALFARRSSLGLVGEEVDVETGAWTSPQSHVGGGIDSYYEYLLKCARLFDDGDCRAMWQQSEHALERYLAEETPSGLWYGQADMNTGARTASEFGALHAFLPAVLVLAGDLPRARRLQDSALAMWNLRGIEPELLDYRTMTIEDAHYPLRPEIVESTYYLYRATRDPRYLEMGRVYLDALVAHCRTDGGYTVIDDVTTMKQGDLQPSFFLAETLKYLYLLFADEPALDPVHGAVVFNTEAHPLRPTWRR